MSKSKINKLAKLLSKILLLEGLERVAGMEMSLEDKCEEPMAIQVHEQGTGETGSAMCFFWLEWFRRAGTLLANDVGLHSLRLMTSELYHNEFYDQLQLNITLTK